MNSSKDANRKESNNIVTHYIEDLDSIDLSVISHPVLGERMIV